MDKALNKNALKTIYMLIIFGLLEKFFDTKKYLEFDFNRFFEDQINNLTEIELSDKVMQY